MQYGIFSPPFGAFSDPRVLAELAHEAEEAGWDGFFLWDHIYFAVGGDPAPIGDPWVTLAAMAAVTSRLRLGTAVTPLPRRHPWKVAREAVSLDRLSGGRLTLGVGLGSDQWGREYSAFGLPAGDRTHAAMLDEGLDVLAGLWRGEPFSYGGTYYQVEDVTFLPRPVQQPRIPIWVAGWWPNKGPFRRAARWDGVVPGAVEGPLTPDDYAAIAAYMRQFRAPDAPFDMVRTSFLPAGDAAQVAASLAAYAAAGVTWWLVPVEDDMAPLPELHARIRQGPPR